MPSLREIYDGTLLLLLVLSGCSAVYYLAVCLAALRFWSDRNRSHESRSADEKQWPAISILKPVEGLDPEFHENIRSHALQKYPRFELLFGVADAADPALQAIRALQNEFPHLRTAAVVCDCSRPGNRKVQRLEALEREAQFDFLLVNDADIRVDANYLREAARPFLEGQNVGLVTCPYRARPGGTFPSLLEALSISAEFQSQVLLARFLKQVNFALGATMLFHREELQRSGGFHSLVPYLADDFRLGNAIAGAGREVVICPHPVEITFGPDTWRQVWRRQLRWSRTIRASRPAGHFGLVFTQGTVWGLLCLLLASATAPVQPAAAILACLVLVLRLVAAWSIGWMCLRSQAVGRKLYWMFLADALSFAAWAASFFVSRVWWRGRLLRLGREGRIESAE